MQVDGIAFFNEAFNTVDVKLGFVLNCFYLFVCLFLTVCLHHLMPFCVCVAGSWFY